MALRRQLQAVWFIRAGRLAAAAALLAGLAQPGAALVRAAPLASCPIVVTAIADAGPGSLRAAVACAQAGETVTFSSLSAGSTLTLTSGEIPITQTITIDGGGVSGVRVDGNNAGRIFNIAAGGAVTLTALILQHGSTAVGGGGAVLADGNSPLVLSQVSVLSSTAPTGPGGGLYTASTLTLTNSALISNTSASDGGGALALGAVTLIGSEVRSNLCSGPACLGGGLSTALTLTLSATTFLSNTSQAQAGGAFAGGSAAVSDSLFQGNTCAGAGCPGGGLQTLGGLSLSNSDFLNNTSLGGGGGANVGGAAVVTGGRFQQNGCGGGTCTGGGLYVTTGLVLSGTDFLTNTSQSDGGGVIAFGALTVTDGVFQGNSCSAAACLGGGLSTAGSLALTNTHVLSNTSQAGGGGALAGGPVLLKGGLFQGNSCNAAACLGGGLRGGSTVTGGSTDFLDNTSQGHGGGVYASGAVALTNGRFEGNACNGSVCLGGGLYAVSSVDLTSTDFFTNTSQLDGGGVIAFGSAVVSTSWFQGNTCSAAGCVGGGLSTAGSLALTDTVFLGNSSTSGGGGALAVGPINLSGGQFQGNGCSEAACLGGGLYGANTVTITGTAFVSNTGTGGGGGLYALGAVTVTTSSFENNACTKATCWGGGLRADGSALIGSSTFSGNQSAAWGGGVGISGTAQLTLANVTLSGNAAQVGGGGLYAGGVSLARLLNVTVADNQAPTGGGLLANTNATIGVTNTVFVNSGGANCAGPIAAGANNFEYPGTTCALAGPTAGFTPTDPRLAPLALNTPGLAWTYALLNDSPARDAGHAATCAGPLVNNRDQRGVTRPLDSDHVPGAVCDAGAFEAGPPVYLLLLPVIWR